MDKNRIIVPKEERARYGIESFVRLMSIRIRAIKRDYKARKINHELCKYFHVSESE